MSEMIRTVLGDINSNLPGICQCHEHLFLEMDKSYEISTTLYMDDLKKSTEELMEYRSAGGSLIVDAQPVRAGRMAENLLKASADSGVHIVSSTGFHKAIFYYGDAYIFHKDEQYITDLYIDEIRRGMVSSQKDGFKKLQARAGIVKTAVDAGGVHADKVYEKLFCAAANAALATGVPVLCHIEQKADALEVARFFMDRGIAADRLIICHMDRARYDFAYHRKVLGTGVYLEYDTINRLKYLSNDEEIKLICAMLDAGFEDRLLLSLDTTNQRLRAYGADMGLDYIINEFAPMLKNAGVSDEYLHKMQTCNARDALKIKI
ncbi:MAG: phosphotriesterase [Eubacteriales bacterium]